MHREGTPPPKKEKHIVLIHEGVPPTPLPTPIHVFTPIPRSSIDSGKMRPSPWGVVAVPSYLIVYMYIVYPYKYIIIIHLPYY